MQKIPSSRASLGEVHFPASARGTYFARMCFLNAIETHAPSVLRRLRDEVQYLYHDLPSGWKSAFEDWFIWPGGAKSVSVDDDTELETGEPLMYELIDQIKEWSVRSGLNTDWVWQQPAQTLATLSKHR